LSRKRTMRPGLFYFRGFRVVFDVLFKAVLCYNSIMAEGDFNFSKKESLPEIKQEGGMLKKIKRPKVLYIVGAFLIIVLIAVFVLIGLKKEKYEISSFELTPKIADGAGINPETGFILKSTGDLSESAIEKYLKTEPQIDLKIKKISSGSSTFEITPKEKLPENKILVIKIEDGPIAEKEYSWAFQIKAPFQVISTLPRDKGNSVPLNTGIEIIFNRENIIEPEKSFEIEPNVQGKFQIHRDVLVFVPSKELQPETIYTVRIKKGIKIKNSNDELSEDKTFQFETGEKGYIANQPYLNFDKMFWEFNPDNEPAFGIYYSNISAASSLPVKVYRFNNVDEFTNAYKSSIRTENGWCRFNRYKPYQASENKKIFEGSVAIEKQLNNDFIRIPQKLNEGFYLLDLTIDKKSYQAWFQVTKIASYLAVSGTKSLVWLKSLDDGKSVENANIVFEDKQIGKTGSDGVAQFDTPESLISKPTENYYAYWNEPPYFYVIKAQGKELAIPIESRYGSFYKIRKSDEWWDFLSLDKTIYLPDDTIKFWGIVKQRNGSDVKGEEITMQISNYYWYGYSPEDVTAYGETKAKISDFYTVTGEINFSGMKPGTYQLIARRGNEVITSANITIAAYIKPAYKLILSPAKKAIFAGEGINFKVRAEFFDGTPVSGLKVKYEGNFNEYFEGTVNLNAQGEGQFSIQTQYTPTNIKYGYEYGWPRYLSANISPVLSEEGEISDSAYVLVFGPEIDLQVRQSVGDHLNKFRIMTKEILLDKVEAGQPFWISENYLGNPVANQNVSIEIIEIIHNKTEVGKSYDFINKATYPIYSYSLEEKFVKKDSVNTDANGEALFEFSPENEKQYRIVFTTYDRNKRITKKINYAYGSSSSWFDDYRWGEDMTLVDLTENKNNYKVGDKVSLQIQNSAKSSPPAGDKKFLFYRLIGGIDSYKTDNYPTYDDTFQNAYIPNVSVTGVWFDGKIFHETWPANLSFDSEEKRLTINTKTNKEQYRPGEEVNLSILIKDKDNKPKQAEVNISALDEAVYMLNPEETDIVNDLYRDVSASLFTRSSHLTPLSSGAEGGGCFLAGTKILTTSGVKNIEEINVGDYIITKENSQSESLVTARVKRKTSHLVKDYLVINNQLKVTGNHKLFANNQWVEAGQIKQGDLLLNLQKELVPVESIQKFRELIWVYNFEIENQHTYFADGFYVHNEEKGGGETRQNFKEVAIYKSVTTNNNGEANLSFKVPDNITSWRLTLQAITKDWFAGKTKEFIPVSLPFFVDIAANKFYLAGDNPVIRARVFGTGGISDSIDYKIESETLPFKSLEKRGSRVEEFNLGQLTSGKHEIKISASDGNFKDAIISEVEVLKSYFTRNFSKYYDVSPSLTNIKGNKNGFTKLLFTSRERGKLYGPLLSFLWQGGARIDQRGSRYIADILLNRFFNEEREQKSIELRSYQTDNGGISLLPYSDDDLVLSAKFADLIKGEDVDISKSALKDYFYNSLKDQKADLSRVVVALYGLSSFGDPVLVSLQNIKNNENLTPVDKAFVALALDTLGAKEEARQYYKENFKPKLTNKNPYIYFDQVDSGKVFITALLANLTASLQEPEAEGLATYVFENRPKDELVNFELLSYIKKTLPNLRGGDVSFTYKTNKTRETKTLKNNEKFELTISSEELASLKFEKVDGRIGVVSFYEAESSPEEVIKDNDIGIQRKYLVDGRETKEFKDGDLVKIELKPAFNDKALPGLYWVIDYLPSGLRAVTEINSEQFRYESCLYRPIIIEEQKITFLTWNPSYRLCSSIYYYARVINKGTFKAEPAIIQSSKNLDDLNISLPDRIVIK